MPINLTISGVPIPMDRERIVTTLQAEVSTFDELKIEWNGRVEGGGTLATSENVPPEQMRRFARAIKGAVGLKCKVVLTATF